MEKLTILVCVFMAAAELAMAIYLRQIEKNIDDIYVCLSHNLKRHNLQGEFNKRVLKWYKNTDKSLDDMLETQKKLTELANETYTKYLEVQAQINGMKFEMDQKELVAEYCANDALATAAVVIDGEENA